MAKAKQPVNIERGGIVRKEQDLVARLTRRSDGLIDIDFCSVCSAELVGEILATVDAVEDWEAVFGEDEDS